MMAIAAARLGYRCHIYDPHEAPCAAEVAAAFTRAAFDDAAALAAFAAPCDVVTYEFENLPAAPLDALGDKLRPGDAQPDDRAGPRRREALPRRRRRARSRRGPKSTTTPSLDAAVDALGLPLLLKTRRFGYDGKGQAWVRDRADEARRGVGRDRPPAGGGRGRRCDFDAEFSVIVARAADGDDRGLAGVAQHPRRRHPAPLDRPRRARRSTAQVAEAVAGRRPCSPTRSAMSACMTVEFFACADGPVVNEIAPRVHNSGHWTIEGAATSQFEQHIRAICGLPLGDTALVARGACAWTI